MNTNTNLTRFSLAGLFAIVALEIASPASAGIHSDGHGGAVCKGPGSCLVLELDCKGTYTDATDPNGTVYGECDEVAQSRPGQNPGFKVNIKNKRTTVRKPHRVRRYQR